jgi:hypothetical protein
MQSAFACTIIKLLKVRSGGSTMSQMVQMRKEAKQQHEELLALLAAHPDLTNSERSSVSDKKLPSPSTDVYLGDGNTVQLG